MVRGYSVTPECEVNVRASPTRYSLSRSGAADVECHGGLWHVRDDVT